MDEPLGSLVIRRCDALKGLRSNHEQTWRDCARYSFPLRQEGFQGQTPMSANQAQQERAMLLDGTSTDACQLLASSLMSGLTPANSQWFELGLEGDEDTQDEGSRWLGDASQFVWTSIHAANYDAEGLESLLDAVWAGWCALYVEEDEENGGYRFEWWPLGGLYCAASKPGGLIDIVYRDFKVTAEQAATDPRWKVSEDVKRRADKNPDEMMDFVHGIYPRKLSVVNAVRAINLPIASCIVERNTKLVVYESGYHEMPVIVPRWRRLPSAVYGVGPMFDALPDTRELNELTYLEKQAVEMSIAPPIKTKDDGIFNPKMVSVGPRKFLVCADPDSMQPLYDGARIDIGWTAKERLQAQIRKTLMSDQLQPVDGPAMTATEVHVRVALIRQLLGPVYGRFQAEFLAPLVRRCFGIALRAGVLGTPPAEVRNRMADVRYISPLARAQKLEEVVATERLFANAGAIAAARPEVMDNLDADQAVREMAEALGVPRKVIRSTDEVAAYRERRRQQEAQAQQQATLEPVLQEVGIEAGKKLVGAN